ncbi:MAG: endonuclease/exonuclease/phosphatase family protein [Gammaproteobacteria bacterium]|nr:endonuclease/exonuclease/phosphatase family protein [Gammaproteobacteria bacterium]
MRFRLITYNIHKGIGGVDRRYRLERIAETLRHYEPDIIFMQEVADGMPRSRRHRQIELLGAELGLPYSAYQRNVELSEGHYGNGILSRFPLFDVSHIDLTVPPKKRRRALVAACRIRKQHERTLLLLNTHLGLAGFERAQQVRRILESERLKHTHRTTPVIVGGDYNDVYGTLNKRFMQPSGFLTASRQVRTFPAVMPMQTLDHIYYRGSITLHHSFPCRRQIARQASDHLPLVVDFELQV